MQTQQTNDGMPEACEYYSTAFCAELGRYCSVVKVDRHNKQYLVNFGHRNVWMNASELSSFVI